MSPDARKMLVKALQAASALLHAIPGATTSAKIIATTSEHYKISQDEVRAIMKEEGIRLTIAPRDYRQPGRVLKQDLSTLLAASPEAFDCLVWIAKDSSHDEQVTVEQDVVGSIESGERAQSYEKPIQARARIVPDDALAFGVLSSALAENFIGASQPMRIILSVPGARKYSLIQWLEFPDMDRSGQLASSKYRNTPRFPIPSPSWQ